MATLTGWAFEGIPEDVVARLRTLGLRVDEQGDDATVWGKTLVVTEGRGRFPHELVARTLGCRSVLRATASFRRLETGGEVTWDLVRMTDGRETTINEAEDGVDDDEAREEPDAIVARWVDDAFGTVLDRSGTPRTFGLRVPRGWRPPDPFARASRGETRSVWSDAHQSCALDALTLAWLSARLDAAGRLDTEQTAPDLARWERRLLARHGSVDAPGYAADWAGLTHGERSRPATRPGYVPAWKLGAHAAELIPAEVATLAALLDLPATRVPPPLVEAVDEVRSLLAGGGPITITPVRTAPT